MESRLTGSGGGGSKQVKGLSKKEGLMDMDNSVGIAGRRRV